MDHRKKAQIAEVGGPIVNSVRLYVNQCGRALAFIYVCAHEHSKALSRKELVLAAVQLCLRFCADKASLKVQRLLEFSECRPGLGVFFDRKVRPAAEDIVPHGYSNVKT